MTTPTVQTHRVLLGDGSTTIGLKLARDPKTGRPLFTREFAEPYADQQFTTLDENAFIAKDQAVLSEVSWAKGFGKQDYVAGHYRQSFGVDASYPGIIVPGPVSVATTKTTPSYASTCTGSNLGFEDGDLTGWTETEVDMTGAVVNTSPQAGTYHYRATMAGTGTINLKQQLTAADSSLFGQGSFVLTITVYARYTTTAPTTATMTLKDGSGVTIQAAVNIGTTVNYAQYTLTHTFAEGWPVLWLHFDITAPALAGTFDIDTVAVGLAGAITTAANMGTIVKLVDFNTYHYAVSTTGVWKRTNDNWARVAGSPDNITDAMSDGAALYLCRGVSKNYWWMTPGELFFRNSGTGAPSQVNRMVWAGGFMWGAIAQSTVYKYNSLATGTVYSTLTVGETGYNINSLLNVAALCHVFTENQHDYISATPATVPNVTPQLRSLYNTNTGKNALYWNTGIYIPAGAQAIIEDIDGDIDSVGPSRVTERLPDFAGQVVALAGDDEWLFALLDNSTKIEILKGRKEGDSWVWHPFFEDTYGTVTGAMISSITAKRLYYWGQDALPKYIPLSTKYADPLTDTALSFLTGTKFETSGYLMGLRNVNKTFASVLFSTTGLSVGHRTILVEYWKAGDSSWTTLGTLGLAAGDSPTKELFFASGVTTKQLWLRFTFTTDDPTVGMGIYYWTPTTTTIPLRSQHITMRCIVGDSNVLESTHAVDDEMIYAKVAAQLRAWANTHPLTLTLWDGTAAGESLTVKFDEQTPREVPEKEGWTEPARSPQSEFDLSFIVQRTS